MRKSGHDLVIAAMWGFAEATLFFIVPDVWLGWVALSSLKRAMLAVGAALFGAVIGGVLVALVSVHVAPDTSFRVMNAVPAVSPQMIERVDRDVDKQGSRAILDGPVRGVPYKLYARAVGLQGRPDATFVVWSMIGRMYRWIILIPLIWLVARLVRNVFHLSMRQTKTVYVSGWCLFYAWFLMTVPWS